MPRKRENKSDDFYGIFPERLRKIMDEQGTTQQELSEYVGKSRQAIGYYADGSSSPDWKTLVSLAQYFRVSTDWLLGLSDTQSTDIDIQQICKGTGLSEGAVNFLSGTGHPYIDAINVLFDARESTSFACYLHFFLLSGECAQNYRKMGDEEYASIIDLLHDTDHTLAARSDIKSLYLQSACDVLRDIMRNEDIRRRTGEITVHLEDI